MALIMYFSVLGRRGSVGLTKRPWKQLIAEVKDRNTGSDYIFVDIYALVTVACTHLFMECTRWLVD